MKKFFLTFLIVVLSPLLSEADTVILKNGMRFESDKIWQEGNEIKCFRNGIIIGFSKNDVERIDRTANKIPQAEPPPLRAGKLHKTPSEATENTVPATEQITNYNADKTKSKNEQKETVETAPTVAAKRLEFNFDEIKKRFERIQKELDLAYQTLLEEFEQLETEKNRLKPGTTTIKYNTRVLRYYQNLKDYDRQRKTFNNEVEAYKAQVEKESYNQVLDDKIFSMILKRWLSGPVDDFIDRWGYPDQIIKMPDGGRQYLFNVEIMSFVTRKIVLETDPSSKIIEFRTDVKKISRGIQ